MPPKLLEQTDEWGQQNIHFIVKSLVSTAEKRWSTLFKETATWWRSKNVFVMQQDCSEVDCDDI